MTKTRYFGPPQCRKPGEQQIPTPIGEHCIHCEEAVQAGDTGTISPYGQLIHYECGLRLAVGSVAHQRGHCSCKGGSEEDPPDMTIRQAAVAAALYFHFGTLPGQPSQPPAPP